jgi:hypothetical protein
MVIVNLIVNFVGIKFLNTPTFTVIFMADDKSIGFRRTDKEYELIKHAASMELRSVSNFAKTATICRALDWQTKKAKKKNGEVEGNGI